MNRKLLTIYLNDHLAGSTTGVELAKRTAGANRGTEYESDLERLATEIDEDREELKRIMRALGVRASPLKPPVAWGAEKLGRLKLNGRLVGYSPLSRLTEVEALSAGVTGKRSLWRCLHELAPAPPARRRPPPDPQSEGGAATAHARPPPGPRRRRGAQLAPPSVPVLTARAAAAAVKARASLRRVGVDHPLVPYPPLELPRRLLPGKSLPEGEVT